jgi:hypothetical protein
MAYGEDHLHQSSKRLRNAIIAKNEVALEMAIASLYGSPGFRLVRRQVGMLSKWLRGEWTRLRKDNEPMPPLPTFLAYVRRLPNPVPKKRVKKGAEGARLSVRYRPFSELALIRADVAFSSDVVISPLFSIKSYATFLSFV